MKIGRQNKGILLKPGNDSCSLWLFLLFIFNKLIWKIPENKNIALTARITKNYLEQDYLSNQNLQKIFSDLQTIFLILIMLLAVCD